MTEENIWMREMGAALSHIGNLESDLYQIRQWLWEHVVASDVLPRELPSEIDAVLSNADKEARKAHSIIGDCLERYCRRPIGRFLRGFDLSREEFYLLRATGVATPIVSELGVSLVDEFEAFRMLHYEDNERECFINPSLRRRRKGKIGIRFGVAPEELSRRALRPEQKEFFLRHLPDVYRRFRE